MSDNQQEPIPEKKEELLAFLEECGITAPNEVAFFVEYINNGMNACRAYSKVYANPNLKSSSVLGNRILSKVNIGALLDITGHGMNTFIDTLERLRKDEPVDYAKLQTKLRKLDVQRIEHGGEMIVKIESVFDE